MRASVSRGFPCPGTNLGEEFRHKRYPLVNVYTTMENHGKSSFFTGRLTILTISTVQFSKAMSQSLPEGQVQVYLALFIIA